MRQCRSWAPSDDSAGIAQATSKPVGRPCRAAVYQPAIRPERRRRLRCLAQAVHSRPSNGNHRHEEGREPVQVNHPHTAYQGDAGDAVSLAPLAIVAALVVVILAVASCDGGDRQQTIPQRATAAIRATPTIEAHVRVRPGRAQDQDQAWGGIWREQTRMPKDREGRGIDAANWAMRTRDAVRNGGQTLEAMAQRIHDEGRFTRQGARVIVSAALSALCPAQGARPLHCSPKSPVSPVGRPVSG